jgi:hypothetical protein
MCRSANLILQVFCLITAFTLSAQKKNSLSPSTQAEPKHLVPPLVEQKFVLENPEAKANWKKEGAFYKAEFINPINNLGYILYYDTLGHMIRREKEMENSEYPAPINDYFLAKYPSEGYVVWSSTDTAGKVSYYSNRSGEVIRFDKDGNYVSPGRLRVKSGDTLKAVIRQ